MFGKRISEYLGFQKVALIVLAVMGLTRLALSLAGWPNSTVHWFSMNLVAGLATISYGVAAYKTGFGGYKQLLPLMLFQMLVFQAVAALGIALAIAGHDNIYAAPEYSFGVKSQAVHLLMHLTVGVVGASLAHWAVGSLAMLITKALSPRRAATAAAVLVAASLMAGARPALADPPLSPDSHHDCTVTQTTVAPGANVRVKCTPQWTNPSTSAPVSFFAADAGSPAAGEVVTIGLASQLHSRKVRIHFKTEAIELPNGCSNDCRKLLSITLLN